MDFGIGSVTAITAICYLGGMACKATTKVKDEVIPVVCGVTGGILGVAGMYLMPEFPATDVINAAAIGIVSGLGSNRSAPGHQAGKQEVEGGDPTISRRQSGSWLSFATSQ